MIHIKLYNCKLKDLDSIYILSQLLAHYFPQPELFVTGIYELLINAIEHGNLGIGYEAKTLLIRQGKLQQEIMRRLNLPEYAHKEVNILLTNDEDECRLTIADQGSGFPWQEYVRAPADTRRPNGRGLRIAFDTGFDRVLFNSTGNEVTCIAKYPDWPAQAHPIQRRA